MGITTIQKVVFYLDVGKEVEDGMIQQLLITKRNHLQVQALRGLVGINTE